MEIGPLRNWIQRQNAAETAAALVQFMGDVYETMSSHGTQAKHLSRW